MEMALITPLLVLLLVGLADFGRVILAQIKLKDAVQEGAVFATYQPGDYSLVQARVVDAANSDLEPDMANSDVAIVCSGDDIEVTGSYSVAMITPIIGQWISGGSFDLVYTAVGTNVSPDVCDPSP